MISDDVKDMIEKQSDIKRMKVDQLSSFKTNSSVKIECANDDDLCLYQSSWKPDNGVRISLECSEMVLELSVFENS